jgi:hypothetical protein
MRKFKLQFLVVPPWLLQYYTQRLSGLWLPVDSLTAWRIFNVNRGLFNFLLIFFQTCKVRWCLWLDWVLEFLHFIQFIIKSVYFFADFLQSGIYRIEHVVNFIVNILLVLFQILFVLSLNFLYGQSPRFAFDQLIWRLIVIFLRFVLFFVNIGIIRVTCLLLLFFEPQQIDKPLIFSWKLFFLIFIHFALECQRLVALDHFIQFFFVIGFLLV